MSEYPTVTAEELAAWEVAPGEYLNRYDARRLMADLRAARESLARTQLERGNYASQLTLSAKWLGKAREEIERLRQTAQDRLDQVQAVRASERDNATSTDFVIAERDAALQLVRELREALKRLAKESSGFLSMADRSHHGNTNCAVLRDYIWEAEAAIARAEAALKEPKE